MNLSNIHTRSRCILKPMGWWGGGRCVPLIYTSIGNVHFSHKKKKNEKLGIWVDTRQIFNGLRIKIIHRLEDIFNSVIIRSTMLCRQY